MAMNELIIDIDSTGQTEAMHFDEFDLKFLGKKKISRASEIFYNEDTELWDIILPGDKRPACDAARGFQGYDEARRFEVEWLQACRKARIQPNTSAGIHIAKQLRTEARDATAT